MLSDLLAWITTANGRFEWGDVVTKENLKNVLTAVRDIINRSSEIGIRKAQAAEEQAYKAQTIAEKAQITANNAKTAAETAQTTGETALTTAETAQTVANNNKEILSEFVTSVVTFTFDKQTSGRDTFVFNAYNYYKISDFNPAPENVISFKGTAENGDDFSIINIGNNCMEYGFFIVVATAGNCSITFNDLHGNPATIGFTAPSAGLYAKYRVDNAHQTAGTGEFTLRVSTGNSPIAGLLLKSSTADSTKKFRITVDDSGALKATEVIST